MDEMFDTLTQYITIWEVLWIVPAVLGFYRYIIIRYRCMKLDRQRYINESPMHKRDSLNIQFDAKVFNYLVIGLVFWCFMWLGFRALLSPNPQSVSGNEIEQAVYTLLFIFCEVLLFVKGEYLDKMDYKAYAKYREELKKEILEEISDDVKGMMMSCTCGAREPLDA